MFFFPELTRTWYSNFVDLHLNSVVAASSAASQHVAPSWFQVFEDELWCGKSWKFWMSSKFHTHCWYDIYLLWKKITAWYKNMFLTGKRKMMCLIFNKGLFDGRKWCVTSLTNNSPLFCYGVTSLKGSIKVPNWSKKTVPVDINPRTTHFQPLGAPEAASSASCEFPRVLHIQTI